MYIQNLQQDVQFYKKTAQEQQIRIVEQNKTIKDYEELTNVMFQYMTGKNSSRHNIPEVNSPIHLNPPL